MDDRFTTRAFICAVPAATKQRVQCGLEPPHLAGPILFYYKT